MNSRSWWQKPAVWIAALVGLVVVILIGTQIGSGFIGARLVGADRGYTFIPLVVHELPNSKLCYDNGTVFCEKYLKAAKKFTVALLFSARIPGFDTRPLYGCLNSKDANSKYLLTTTQADCKQQKLNSQVLLGHVATNDQFEASTKISYCPDSGKAVIGSEECSKRKELGYATVSGAALLSERTTLCDQLSINNPDLHSKICVTVTPTPTPTPEVAPPDPYGPSSPTPSPSNSPSPIPSSTPPPSPY